VSRAPLALAVVATALALAAPAEGHELRSAFAELTESADAVDLTVSWPETSGAPEQLDVRLPGCSSLPPEARSPRVSGDGRVVEHHRLRCAAPLLGSVIDVVGLTAAVPEIVVHAELAGHAPVTAVARREQPTIELGERDGARGSDRGEGSFVALGVRHILRGMDHLLFVGGLLLLVLRATTSVRVLLRRLAGTVTAFTIAHTLTLGLATFGAATLPPRGVECAIALSILAVAVELARAGPAGESAAARGPWPTAFAFGLLHGFGFAGALSALGLPRAALPSALFFFNVGVEIGQLAFVAACLVALSIVRRVAASRVVAVERAVVYAIGSLAAYWFLARTLTLFGWELS
jgi:hypothetical protein